MATIDKKQLLLLFDRPLEPTFFPKGKNHTIFNVPLNYLPDKLKSIVKDSERLVDLDFTYMPTPRTAYVIDIKEVPIPYMQDILDLKRDANFSLFIPKHQKLAGRLIKIFMKMKDTEDLKSIAAYAFNNVNPYLFNYAFSVALLHRKDTEDLELPTFIQSFPDRFLDPKVFGQARELTRTIREEFREPIELPVDWTATDFEREHRLAYFREDLGVNLHHWHWHLVYPYQGPKEVVSKDRRGELFYYMHQQIIARYNFERLCNGLKRVTKLSEFREPIKEAYFSKLTSKVSYTSFGGRVANQKLRDIDRGGSRLDVADLERWRERILSAISHGFVVDTKGQKIELTEDEGIDILGNVIESSDLSPNKALYGNLHNFGHNFIAAIHDPDNRHLEPLGVMAFVETAMRDPVFYRWHAFIDHLFQQFKETLPPYSEDQLKFPGITISDVLVETEKDSPNTLKTFWLKSTVELSSGMDFQGPGPVHVRFTHLQHEPFTYTIVVENGTNEVKKGTCRIFLSPKFNEKRHCWNLKEQRLMFIELDKFTITLQPGENILLRKSTDSSVTIPFERIFPHPGEKSKKEDRFCGCGWPQYMLIPKGTSDGISCKLFVMVSNYDDDKVARGRSEDCCKNAASYCGIKDKLYPDKRAMGYPFDRLPKVKSLEKFLTSNMFVQEITIMAEKKTNTSPIKSTE